MSKDQIDIIKSANRTTFKDAPTFDSYMEICIVKQKVNCRVSLYVCARLCVRTESASFCHIIMSASISNQMSNKMC